MINEKLLEKVIEIFKDNSGSLLGDYRFESEELDELKKHFISKASECLDSYRYDDNDIAVFIIIVINKLRDWNKEWSNFGFWDQINIIFDDNYFIYKLISSNQHNKLYEGIDRVFKKYGRVLFKTNSGDRAFVQTFLYQAMAPRVSFEHFVNLAWRKYFDDLECDYSSADIDFCKYIINCLAKKITSPDEDSNVQFGSEYYQLRTAFKYGIVQNREKTVNLLNKVLLAIDKVDKNNEDLSSDTLGTIITDVVTRNKKIVPRISKTGIVYRSINTAHSFDQLRPILNIDFSQHEKPTISICFPRMILLGNEKLINQVQLTIYKYLDGKQVYLKSFTPRPIKNNGESSLTMSAFSEDITDLLYNEIESFDYEFVLTGDNGEQYSSKKEFFRDYFLFNKEREVKGDAKPGSYTLIVPKNFDINKNIKLFSKSSGNIRNLWKNIWIITTEDYDSIEYLNSFTLFSIRGLPASVRFEDESILPYDSIKVLKDNEVFEIYREFSNLYIINNDESKPETIRIVHELKSIDGTVISYNEKRLSDLRIVNYRYLYDAIENNLNVEGIHSLEVIKIATGQANKFLLNKKYIIDTSVEQNIKTIPYISGNHTNNVIFFNENYEYECCSDSEEAEFFIDHLNLTLIVKNPYFAWCFGSDLNDIHISSFNLTKPIICNLIKSTNETVVLKTNLDVECLMFDGTGINGKCKVLKGTNNCYLLSQFINSGKKEGTFYVESDGKRLDLFSITDKPYTLKPLQECLSLDGNILKINLVDYFAHDDSFYKLKLTFVDKGGKKTDINDLSFEKETIVDKAGIIDGYYEVFLSYSKVYAGEESPYIKLKSEEIELGDILKCCFSSSDKINLNNFRTFELNSRKISCKDSFIEKLSFKDYSLDGDCVFIGVLRTRNLRPQKIQFIHKNGRVIKDLCFVYGQDGSIIKNANYDTQKESFTDELKGNNIVEFKTIYYKN